MVTNPRANAGDPGVISGSGRFPGEGNSNVCVCVMVFAKHQHVSATVIRMSPFLKSPHPIPLGCPRALALGATLQSSC